MIQGRSNFVYAVNYSLDADRYIGSDELPVAPIIYISKEIADNSQIDFSQEIKNFWEKKAELTNLNPLGHVPVLVDLNGSILTDSTAIVEYLEEFKSQK